MTLLAAKQPAWWCHACGSAALVARGLCRACYDRRRRSGQHFAGHREAVLTRDLCCQTCLADARIVARALVVHHRQPGVNKPAAHITLCRRCHVRVHRRNQLPGWYSDLFFRLWQELHPGAPAQLRLPLAS
jgi:hypothetical protein